MSRPPPSHSLLLPLSSSDSFTHVIYKLCTVFIFNEHKYNRLLI